jgi:hypothetical protein
MKIETQDFAPQVWETSHQGAHHRFLVCGKRYVHSPFTGEDRKTCDRLTHPIAILISNPAVIIPNFTDNCHEWKVSAPQDHGIKTANAQRALAQAWRMVEGVSSSAWPAKEFLFKFKANLSIHSDLSAPPQEMTMLRNVTLCLWWDAWKKLDMTAKQMAREISAAGMPITGGQLTKAGENLGLY